MDDSSSSARGVLIPQNSAVSYLDLRGLNEEEKERIRKVVLRDQEFKTQEGLSHVNSGFNKNMEGQLCKFTNLVKGWQYRWFVLDAEAGTLTYYLGKEKVRNRGCLLLTNAVISPSDEDSMSFTVNACNGDIYKLRASDAKERQHWINLLRAVAEFHGQTSVNPVQRPPSPAGERLMSQLRRSATLSTGSPSHSANKPSIQKSASISYHDQFPRTRASTTAPNPIEDELKDIKDALTSVNEFHSSTIEALESNQENSDEPSSLDEQVLLLKATSQATVSILHRCYNILHKQSTEIQGSALPSGLPPGATIEWLEPKDGAEFKGSPLASSQGSIESAVEELPIMDIDFTHIKQYASHEIQDKEVYTDSQLEDMESHKSVILHLLSQLKLGMDLTRVVLPTFVLEKRSLLEMYADFLGHADLFIRIPDYETPEDRMLAVLIFYLTSFHVGRKSAVAKKPYNPIIGERFHCSMLPTCDSDVSKEGVESLDRNVNGCNGTLNGSIHEDDSDRVYFVAEQVSHHPPISAFYAECPSKQISMNSHIWTKSKFYGMSIGVINVGEGVISLSQHNEDYVFTFPNAYCRSILTVPWIELGGKTYIQCHQTGYSAVVTFHTKPFYGGKHNRITFEMRRPGPGEVGDVVCQGEGTWDGVIEMNFTNSSVEKKIIDVSTLEITKKHVRPREMQAECESRRLWSKVTDALLSSNLEEATNEKHKLEEKQRAEARERLANGTEWKPRLFQKHSDSWVFNPAFAMLPRRRKFKSTSSDR